MSNNNNPWDLPSGNVILAENEVHVWRASLGVPLSMIYDLQRVLPTEEAERSRRFYFEKDRQHWIVAHGVLRMLLGCYVPGKIDSE